MGNQPPLQIFQFCFLPRPLAFDFNLERKTLKSSHQHQETQDKSALGGRINSHYKYKSGLRLCSRNGQISLSLRVKMMMGWSTVLVLLLRSSCGFAQSQNTAKIDTLHGTVSRKIAAPFVWFDRHFGTEEDIESSPGVFLNVSTETTKVRGDESLNQRTRLHTRMYLPGIDQRWRLWVKARNESDDAEAPLMDASLDAEDLSDTTEDELETGLLYELMESRNVSLDQTAGVAFTSDGLTAKSRIRLRSRMPIGEEAQIRNKIEAFWQSSRGFGAELRLGYESLMSNRTLWRYIGSAIYREDTKGLNIRAGFDVFTYLSKSQAIVYGLQSYSQTDPLTRLERMNSHFEYRFAFLRPWNYLAISPEVNWRRDERFRGIPQITLKWEVHFGNQEFHRYAPPQLSGFRLAPDALSLQKMLVQSMDSSG